MKFTVTSHLSFLPNNPISTQFDVSNIRDIKVELMKIIAAIIDKSLLRQEQTAQILKTTQARISQIKHLKTEGFALERLFLFLLRLNCAIDLVITSPENVATTKVQHNIKDVKLEMMYFIVHMVTKYYLSQAEAAKAMHTNQPKISNINRLKTDNFAIEYLLTLMTRLECNIEIIIKD